MTAFRRSRGRVAMISAAGALAIGPWARAADAPAVPPGKQALAGALAAEHPGAICCTEADGNDGPGRITSVYGAVLGDGVSPEPAADGFMRSYAALLGALPDDLKPGSLLADGRRTQQVWYDDATNSYKFTLVYFTQQRDGVPVYMADLRVLCRNQAGFPIVLARSNLRELGNFRVPGGAAGAAKAVAANFDKARAAARTVLPGATEFSKPAPVIWAGFNEHSLTPVLAMRFDAADPKTSARRNIIADASTGAVLHSEDELLHVDVSGTVMGNATPGLLPDALAAEAPMPLPYAAVSIGATTAYADALGNFTIPNAGSGIVMVGSQLRGRWFQVFNLGGSSASLSQNITPPGPANFLHNPSDSEFTTAEVNAYIHANKVRDHVLRYNPQFPGLVTSSPFTVNVNVSSTCNSYYNASNMSINFYMAGPCDGGGSGVNTAYSSLVHHEYGHHLVQQASSGQDQYGEGYADTTALAIADDPGFGYGFYAGGSAPLRSANNFYAYPCSIGPHTCGQILSGAVWQMRNRLMLTDPVNYRDVVSRLVVNSVLMHTGSTIDPQIGLDFLVLDDDDGDLNNGTPHLREIYDGFATRQIAPSLPAIGFRFVGGRPERIAPAGGTFDVEVIGLSGAPQAASLTAFYDLGVGGGAQATGVQTLSGNTYRVSLPAAACGTGARFWLSALSSTSAVFTSPPGAPAASWRIVYATGTVAAFADNFETDAGWTVTAGPNLTDGAWERGYPLGGRGAPPTDGDGSGRCFVTANRAGNSDVDGDSTILTSPLIDATGGDARLSYLRWFDDTNGSLVGSAVLRVEATNNGAEANPTWVTLETVGPTGPDITGGWVSRTWRIADYFPVPSNQFRVRFTASDPGNQMLLECAVDAVKVTAFSCAAFCPADFNHDWVTDIRDIFVFLSAWFAHGPGTDVDNNGVVDIRDIFAFLAVWFAGC